MLGFFRKYQTYFFAITAVVVIISFSFFGTYNTIPAENIHEQVAFTAIDGTNVKRSDLEEMATFIGTDSEDKWLWGGVWGPNFLNDGVINSDILKTGLGEILVAAYPSQIASDLELRTAKEKRYNLYSHPQAKFISAESAWTFFAPQMKSQFDALRSGTNPVDPETFAARVNLYLAERQFPAPMLQQVLMYQQKQFSWVPPDPNLNQTDLSLFGYHTLDDWFGPRFTRLVAEFIINSSKIAEQKGYEVSKAEALTDLRRNAEINFQQNIKNPHLGVASSNEYFNEQLRRMGMDQNKAAKVWRQVLLFRRLFQDVGNAALIDTLAHQQFLDYAKETVIGELYQLPKDLRFSNYRNLQKFEIYLDAISKRDANANKLTLPTTFLTVAEVKKKSPELVQKRYVLQVAQVQKKALQTKVGLKEMWKWESAPENWDKLKTQFPELGIKKADTTQERLAVLDNFDDMTRSRIDAFARAEIVDQHPEWLQNALQDAEPKKMTVGMRPTGGSSFVAGLSDRTELMKLLDQAPLNQTDDQLAQFTGDNNTYYRITVLERTPDEEILTFAEANKDGILDQLLDRTLETHYAKVRDSHASKFQNDDKEWKPLSEVSDQVADLYFEKILNAIRKDYATAKKQDEKKLTPDVSASLRFYAYTRALQGKLKQDSPEASQWVRDSKTDKEASSLQTRSPLFDQWKLEKTDYRADRSADPGDLDKEEMFALTSKLWTPVHTPVNGDIYFFQLQNKENGTDITALYDKEHEAHALLSDDAQRHLMLHVVTELKDKNAISLDYLNPNIESMGPKEE